MKRYHYIKEHLPTNKRWVRTVEYDSAAFLHYDLNEWNASSLTWKFWQPTNEHLMMRGIDPETLRVHKEQSISITQQRRLLNEQTTEEAEEVGRDHRHR